MTSVKVSDRIERPVQGRQPAVSRETRGAPANGGINTGRGIASRDIYESPRVGVDSLGKPMPARSLQLRFGIESLLEDCRNFAADCRYYAREVDERYRYVVTLPYDNGKGEYEESARVPRSDLGRAIEAYRAEHHEHMGSTTHDRFVLRTLGKPIRNAFEARYRNLWKELGASRRAQLRDSRADTEHRILARDIRRVHAELSSHLAEVPQLLDGAFYSMTFRSTPRAVWRSLTSPFRQLGSWLGRCLQRGA